MFGKKNKLIQQQAGEIADLRKWLKEAKELNSKLLINVKTLGDAYSEYRQRNREMVFKLRGALQHYDLNENGIDGASIGITLDLVHHHPEEPVPELDPDGWYILLISNKNNECYWEDCEVVTLPETEQYFKSYDSEEMFDRGDNFWYAKMPEAGSVIIREPVWDYYRNLPCRKNESMTK